MAYGQNNQYYGMPMARRVYTPRPIPTPPPLQKPVDEKPTEFHPAAEGKAPKPLSTDSGAGTTEFRPMPYVRGALAFGNIAYPGQVGRGVQSGHPDNIPNALANPSQGGAKAIPLTPSRFSSIQGVSPRKPGKDQQ